MIVMRGSGRLPRRDQGAIHCEKVRRWGAHARTATRCLALLDFARM